MSGRKLAFFDFDGTLSRGYISIAFLDFLFSRGLYDPEEYKQQTKLVDDYKNGKISYDSWGEAWGETWAGGLKGVDVRKVNDAAKEFFIDFQKNIYPVAFDVVKLFKKHGYSNIMVSTGAVEVIGQSAGLLGFDQVYGTKLETKDGKYTGGLLTNLHLPQGKGELVSQLIVDADAESFGFGDSHSDIGFMKLTKYPFAINPSPQLEQYASEHNWPIVRLGGEKDQEIVSMLGRLLK